MTDGLKESFAQFIGGIGLGTVMIAIALAHMDKPKPTPVEQYRQQPPSCVSAQDQKAALRAFVKILNHEEEAAMEDARLRTSFP